MVGRKIFFKFMKISDDLSIQIRNERIEIRSKLDNQLISVGFNEVGSLIAALQDISLPPKRKTIAILFDDIAKNMLQSFEGWDAYVSHPGEKGGIRERRVQDFLKKYLPDKYGVTSGHIIDWQGVESLQEDIVIFDKFNCPTLKADPYYQVFPCETVYATVEVKSTLNIENIGACIDHTYRLKQLDRASELGPIESFVFAYDSYDSKEPRPATWAREKFKEIASSGDEKKPMPSVVICLKKNFILCYSDAKKEEYEALTVDEGLLLFYFDLLLSKLSSVHTSPPSLFTQYVWSILGPKIRVFL